MFTKGKGCVGAGMEKNKKQKNKTDMYDLGYEDFGGRGA